MKYIQNEITSASAEAQLESLKTIVALLNNDTLYANSFKEPADPYTAVDLGLSVKWANMNIGATSEEEAGLYFAWSDTEGFKASEVSGDIFSSSWYSSRPGATLTRNITPDSGYDTARVNMGGSWRMPTKAEMNELVNYGHHTWTTVNGINGYKIVNSSDSSKYIFLPAAGFGYEGRVLRINSYGNYWSSTINFFYPNTYVSPQLDFSNNTFEVNNGDRRVGKSIRGVQA